MNTHIYSYIFKFIYFCCSVIHIVRSTFKSHRMNVYVFYVYIFPFRYLLVCFTVTLSVASYFRLTLGTLPVWVRTQLKQQMATMITAHARKCAQHRTHGLHECHLRDIVYQYQGDCLLRQHDILLPQTLVTRRISRRYPDFLAQSTSFRHISPHCHNPSCRTCFVALRRHC